MFLAYTLLILVTLNNLRKGENMEVNDRLYDLIIIGGGPARTFCRYIYGKSKIQNINT